MSRNIDLAAARKAHNLTQAELAELVKVEERTVQRWESNASTRPQPAQLRRLVAELGLPVERLGFPADKDVMVVEDGRGGHDLEVRFPPLPSPRSGPAADDYSGIWLSRYEYFSSSRGEQYSGLHHVVLEQDGSKASVRSLPNSASSTMSMDLAVAGHVLTGTWVEDTDKTGYYRGAQYVGAIQMLAGPSGARLAGKWLGYGKEGSVNTGPWVLEWQAAVTPATIAEYDRPPND